MKTMKKMIAMMMEFALTASSGAMAESDFARFPEDEEGLVFRHAMDLFERRASMLRF